MQTRKWESTIDWNGRKSEPKKEIFFCVVFILPSSYLACCTTKANAECCDAETINKLRGKGKKKSGRMKAFLSELCMIWMVDFWGLCSYVYDIGDLWIYRWVV